MKIAMTADLHLERNLRAGLQKTEMDTYTALDSLKTQILNHGCEALIIAGDIFEWAKIPGRAEDRFKAFVRDLKDHRVQVLAIEGNHDRQPPTSADRTPLHQVAGAYDIDGSIVRVGGLVVHGISYCQSEELLQKLHAISKPIDLLILHSPVQELLGFDGAYAFAFKDIPACVKYCVCGDIHKAVCLPRDNGGWFLSPGATAPNKIDEDKAKGFWILDTDHPGSPEFVTIWHRNILRGITVSTPEEMQALKELCALEANAEAVLEVGYTPEYMTQIQQLTEAFSGVLLSQQVTIGRLKMRLQTEAEFKALSLKDALPLGVNREQDPVLFGFMAGLLDVNGSAAEVGIYIDDWVKAQ